MEILPTIAFADVARTGGVECILLSVIHGCERETKWALLGRERPPRSMALDPAATFCVRFCTKPRCEEHIRSQCGVTVQVDLNDQYVAVAVWHHAEE